MTGVMAMAFAFVWQRYYHDPEKHPKISKVELDYIRQGQLIDGASPTAKKKDIPISHLVAGNVNLALVKPALGHKSILSTMMDIAMSDHQAPAQSEQQR